MPDEMQTEKLDVGAAPSESAAQGGEVYAFQASYWISADRSLRTVLGILSAPAVPCRLELLNFLHPVPRVPEEVLSLCLCPLSAVYLLTCNQHCNQLLVPVEATNTGSS